MSEDIVSWLRYIGDAWLQKHPHGISREHEAADEIERLRPYEEAIAKMASQFVCPRMTAEDLLKQILESDYVQGADAAKGGE